MTGWTKEQEEAIYSRGCNLLVAAAAGSGKTAVLVERIITRICDEQEPVDVDDLLVVTFTNAAAAEMKERIGMGINKALKENPLSRHLYRQSALLNKASIMTLHSFCLDIVKQNFYILGIDPHFRIADETEAELLRLDVLEDLLEKYYTNCQEGDAFSNLIDAYGGQQDDSLLQELIIKLYLFSRSNPWPEHWLKKVVNSFTTTDWFQWLLPSIKMNLNSARELLSQASNLAASPGGPTPYLANLTQEISMLDDLLGAAQISWNELYHCISGVGFAKLPRMKKDEIDPEIQERVKSYRDKAKEIIKDLQNKYFHRSPQELLIDLENLKPHLQILCQLVSEFNLAYKEVKSKKNLMDFSDLEHFCLQLLMHEESIPEKIIPSELSKKMQEKFVEVLVDEYQDINEVQETILQLVSRNDNLFMVGDVKQSIYRFRLAKPELFQEKYQNFSTGSNSLNSKIDLTKNFRCRREIVEGVNFIFKQIMGVDLGEIPYNEQAQLVYGAQYPECQEGVSIKGPVEFHLLEKNITEELEEEWTPLEREALIIGRRIKEFITNNYLVYDKKLNNYRPVTYADIVILLRSPKGTAETFLEQFRLMGIPVYAELGSGYFKATEIQVILSLLKVIDNPRQDIPLAGVLRSPIMGLSAEDLISIRLNCPQGDFYEAVVKTSQLEKDQLALKLKGFLQQLEKWRTLARQDDLANLIWTLYRETGYFDYVGAMPGGSQRQANLRALHDRARQYETTSFRGLFMFLRFLERMQENQSDLEAAKALSENENVVRIMSIHKSKGLEFPVVFVAGLGKEFNMLDTRQDVTLHKELGLGPVFIDAEKRIKYPTIAKLAIDNKIKFETLAEEMRILYVALTRAREKLILVGSIRDLKKKVEDWCQFINYPEIKIPDSQLVQARTYLDWIGPSLVRHSDNRRLCLITGMDHGEPNLKDNSTWYIEIYQEGIFLEHDTEVAVTREILEYIKEFRPVQVNPYLYDKISQRLDWHYPFEKLINKRAKVTVTEIKHKFQELVLKEEGIKHYRGFSKRPVFLQKNKGLSAQEKGSALHLVMQHIDLSREIIDEEYLESLLVNLENREILTKEQRQVINKYVIVDFFRSSIGKRLLKAQRVKREVPFSLALPAYEVYDDLEETEEKVLLQGVIDCLWFEDGGWILLDYKSDNVQPEGVDQFVRLYTGQINLYTRAVETIWKQPVLEKYLYLFSLGKELKIN